MNEVGPSDVKRAEIRFILNESVPTEKHEYYCGCCDVTVESKLLKITSYDAQLAGPRCPICGGELRG